MAGPAMRVLCPSFASGTVSADLLELSGALGGIVDDAWPHEVNLQITDTRFLGGDYHGEARLFLYQLQPADLEDVERARIAQEFGLDPTWEFVLAAMSNRGQDHQILGELALHLATTYSGIIDFCGALVPPPAQTINPYRSTATRNWETIEPYHNVV
jgi:hypothetical protein